MRPRSLRPVLISGGAGFIGTNLAQPLLRAGRQVRIYDNLSRAGAQENLRWLRAVHGSLLQFHRGDVRNPADHRAVLADVDTVFHVAAQVAVTGWRPKTTVGNGLRRLYDWISVNRRAAPAARGAGT